MKFQQNVNVANWLVELNGKTVDAIYFVDFSSENRNVDDYLPWLYFITFVEYGKFLEIEGDFDGNHIMINLVERSRLNQRLNECDQPELWSVFSVERNEALGKFLNQKIDSIEFGVDKDEYIVNGTTIKGDKSLFTFIRLNIGPVAMTIFEGSATGLAVSENPKVKLAFEETFDTYSTAK